MKTRIAQLVHIFALLVALSCNGQQPYVIILGIAQDGGYPQAGCIKECCRYYHDGKEKRKHVSCIAIVDPGSSKTWMIDATPDFPVQYQRLTSMSGYGLDGILLTHAHIGHYTGLMQLGREVMGFNKMPVYSMPRMKSFIENNGPWSQLVKLNNIELVELKSEQMKKLSDQISIIPIQVPHRDEFSETVGFIIQSESKKVVFIPDIDKWSTWNRSIVDLIKSTDLALIDGTFYKNGEIEGRDMSAIPHPFIEESISLFESFPIKERKKIKFIHLNHTNPVLRKTKERRYLIKKGFGIAVEGEKLTF